MNSDSLLKAKLKNLRTQPPTCRGKMIDWYCSLANRPFMRCLIFVAVCLFIFGHLLAFVTLVNHDLKVS